MNELLKDICSRIPYGLKVCVPHISINSVFNLIGVQAVDKELTTAILTRNNGIIHVPINLVKPYLSPLSSMTEEQFKEMQEIIGNPNEACISVNTSGLELWLNSVDTDPTIWLDTVFELQDWLNKNKFDYKWLIKKSLALDATNLNIY